jgi:hypothetical protein
VAPAFEAYVESKTSGAGSSRGGPEQVEKVQLGGERNGAVEDGDVLDQGEGDPCREL